MYFRYQRCLKRNPAPWVVVCGTRANPFVVEYHTLVVMVVVGRTGGGDSPFVGGRHGALNNRDVERSRMVGGYIVERASRQ